MNNPTPPSSSVLSFTTFLFFFFFFFFSSSVSAFNITRLLNRFPEFGAFNNYITKTRLFEQINARQTITVLALDSPAVAAISGNSLDVIKQILSAHVILDYYDTPKFRKLAVDKPTVLTTMFQSTGDAVYQQGFVKVMHNKRGEIEFGSAGKNAPFTAKFERSVASQPYNISVLQISSPIVVPGIGVYNLPPPAPAPELEVRVPAPAPASSADAPSPADDDDTGSPAPAPSPADDDNDTGSPADAPSPAANSPAPTADAPDAPASSPPKPADDAEDADAPGPADADDKAAATRGRIAGAGVVLAGLVSLSLAF